MMQTNSERAIAPRELTADELTKVAGGFILVELLDPPPPPRRGH